MGINRITFSWVFQCNYAVGYYNLQTDVHYIEIDISLHADEIAIIWTISTSVRAVLHSIALFEDVVLSGDYSHGRHVAYTRPVRSCVSKSDCDVQSGESCFFLYEGCSTGQCMCEATRRKQESAKYCTSSRTKDSPTTTTITTFTIIILGYQSFHLKF